MNKEIKKEEGIIKMEKQKEQLFKLFSKVSVDNDDNGKKLQLLKLIVKNKKKLEGGETTFVRTYRQITGILIEIEIEIKDKNNLLRITVGLKNIIGWESKKKEEFVEEFVFDIDYLKIVVNNQGIDFFQNSSKNLPKKTTNLGEKFPKRITILFKET